MRSERDALQSERTNTAHIPEEEQEKLRSHLTSLTEERDQLQEILEGVREEKSQLKRDLQEKEEMVLKIWSPNTAAYLFAFAICSIELCYV